MTTVSVANVTHGDRKQRRCTATTAHGTPCRMPRLKGRAKCWAHDKGHRVAAQRARAKGGRHTAVGYAQGRADVETVKALQGHLGQVLGDCLLLPNTARRAHTIARLLVVGLQLLDADDLRARVEYLENVMLREEGRR